MLHESGEMYLETILILSLSQPKVRAVDVAKAMDISKPSVSRALSKLESQGYLHFHMDKTLVLTPAGSEIASKIYERHTVLTQLLMRLGVDEATAAADACKMEHDISDASFAAIKQHMEKYS